ncbi:MAG TPA: sigma-70 family RNA polymerase sigma factor [Thermoanaerobaculia bacterium]
MERFAEAWASFAPRLARLCRRWTGTLDEADEAFSRTALVAFEHYLRRCPQLRNADAWLTSIARNVCIDLYRERRRDRLVLVSDSDWWDTCGETRMATSEERILASERVRLAHVALKRLPARMKLVISLLDRAATHEELGLLLGITPVNARKRLEQARRLLRQEIALLDQRHPFRATRRDGLFPTGASLAVAVLTSGAVDGVIYARISDVRAASRIETLRSYVAKHPRGTRARLELARAERLLGRFDEAARHYMAVIERTRSTAAAFELALLFRIVGSPSYAAACAPAIDVAPPPSGELLRVLLSGDPLRSAALALRRPSDRDARLVAARLALDHAAAARALEWAMPLCATGDTLADSIAVEALLDLDRDADVTAMAARLAARDPANPIAAIALARVADSAPGKLADTLEGHTARSAPAAAAAALWHIAAGDESHAMRILDRALIRCAGHASLFHARAALTAGASADAVRALRMATRFRRRLS